VYQKNSPTTPGAKVIGGIIENKKSLLSMVTDPVQYLIEAKEAFEKSLEKYTLIRD
jgi:hypothetical protein